MRAPLTLGDNRVRNRNRNHVIDQIIFDIIVLTMETNIANILNYSDLI
jgi:hypothetical protein